MAHRSASQLFFRFKRLRDKYLITNDYGNYRFLSAQDFEEISLHDRVREDLYRELERELFVLSPKTLPTAVNRFRARKKFLNYGPFLHMLVVTLRCNHSCRYCQVSRAPMNASETDMSPAMAEKIVDRIFESSSPFLSIEFQGGEPLVNFPVIKHVMEYAREKNKTFRKHLSFSMVSTLSLLTEEIVDWVVAPDMNVCTSIDGVEMIHNKNRKFRGNSYEKGVEGIRWINSRYREKNYDPLFYKVQALLTTTRDCLPYHKEIIDNYIDLGMHVIHLRPLMPFGFATNSWKQIGYPSSEFLDFYRKSVDYLIELNQQGVQILEKTANLILMKLFNDFDPNFVDLRNPAGDAIGGLGYNYDGNVFSSDEGRMVYEMGDDAFLLGNVERHSLSQILTGETVKGLVTSSVLDVQPECSQCVYNTYCGQMPTYNYVEQGGVFGQMATNRRCEKLKGIYEYLFGKIMDADPETVAIFERWGSIRMPEKTEG